MPRPVLFIAGKKEGEHQPIWQYWVGPTDPNVLEFWLHRDSSTVFMVKPQENARLVEMVMNQSMAGFQFDNTRS